MDRESILRLSEAYQLVCEQDLPSTQGTTDKDRKPGFYNVPNKGRRYWTGDKWTYQNPLGGIGQATRGVADVLSRNAQRAAETGANVIGGIYDKSKEVGDNIVRGGAEVIDGFTGGSGARDFVKDRQDAAKERQDAYGGKTPSQLAADALKDPGRAVQNVTSAPDAIRPLKPGESGGSGGGAGGGAGGGTGDGGDEGSSGQTEPQVRPVQPTNRDGSDATQKGPNSAGLTPMQQWAKNFPKLAAKVRPGQAGYDEIQKMNQPSATPATQQQTQNASKLGDTAQRTKQAFSNQNQGLNKVSQPISRSMSRVSDAASKMNNVKQSNSKLAFRGLPESYTPDDIVMNFLMEGLNHDEQSARALIPHLSPEFRAYIEENWAQDWAKKAGSFLNNAGRAVTRGTQGKKVDKNANPVHRALNSITRGTGDTFKAFGSGLTQKSGSSDSATKDQKDKEETPKTEPRAETPKTEPRAQTPAKPKEQRAPKPKSSGTSRLDSALKWASDPKNKDAWMKEALEAMCEGLPEPKVHWQKDMDPYDRRRMPGMHAPGSPLPPKVPSTGGVKELFGLAKKKDVKKPKNVKKA